MQNCSFYSHYPDFEKIEKTVRYHLPKAKIEITGQGLKKSLKATLKGGLFGKTQTLELNLRQRQNPSYTLEKVECELTRQLSGMVNFVNNLPAQNPGIQQKFIHKIMSVNCEVGVIATPSFSPAFAKLLQHLVGTLDGFVFAQPDLPFSRSGYQHFLDQELRLILDTAGNSEVADVNVSVEAKYHDPPASAATDAQLKRKAASEAFLTARNIKINTHLPCVPDEANVTLRSQNDVVARAYALMMVAVKGEGLEQEHLERAIREKQITGFSPEENRLIQAAELTQQERVSATWRYESLYVILWALGIFEDLKYPDAICDVPAVSGALYTPSREEFEQSAKLRTPTEILDELDKTYRMNWACVDARIKGQQPGGGLEPGVVYERHYALNWVTCFMNQDWDDVETRT